MRLGETGNDAQVRGRRVLGDANIWPKPLQREGGSAAKVASGLGGESLASHIDAERVTKFFGEQHNIESFKGIARMGVPVHVGPGGNLER